MCNNYEVIGLREIKYVSYDEDDSLTTSSRYIVYLRDNSFYLSISLLRDELTYCNRVTLLEDIGIITHKPKLSYT
jgi:hypothetical protein